MVDCDKVVFGTIISCNIGMFENLNTEPTMIIDIRYHSDDNGGKIKTDMIHIVGNEILEFIKKFKLENLSNIINKRIVAESIISPNKTGLRLLAIDFNS